MDPFLTLSAAAVTKRLKLGTAICLVIQRDTIQTAKAVVSLDQLSKVWFLFGIGCGWNACLGLGPRRGGASRLRVHFRRLIELRIAR
jgi:alkanesulfonate monooxygenase SsuD/methylene tetrahydromethanopterin reductase-like flavin-dependent oxidoreductase (luciferase family)